MSIALHQVVESPDTPSVFAGSARRRRDVRWRDGFTLVELLVVIGIIALLISTLLPALSRATKAARQIRCASNLHQIGIAIFSYANNNNGYIPYGPITADSSGTPLFDNADSFESTGNMYMHSGDVTSLLTLPKNFLGDNSPTAPVIYVGLGLLIPVELGTTPQVLFCPDTEQDSLADVQLSILLNPDNPANQNDGETQGDYYYRHGSGTSIDPSSDGYGYDSSSTTPLDPIDESSNGVGAAPLGLDHIKLENLGMNFGIYNPDPNTHVPVPQKVSALVMDINFLWDGENSPYDNIGIPDSFIYQRTCHGYTSDDTQSPYATSRSGNVNILFSDGHVQNADNHAYLQPDGDVHGDYTADLCLSNASGGSLIQNAPETGNMIIELLFERADTLAN